MNYQAILNNISKYRQVILTVVGLLVLFIIVCFAFNKCSEWLDSRELEKGKEETDRQLENVNLFKGDLQNLKIQEKIKEMEVNIQRNVYSNSLNETNQQRNQTNQHLFGINAIESANYTGKDAQTANTARCRAFPNSQGC